MSESRLDHVELRYVSRSLNGRYVREHVVVAERALGRRLPMGVVVHHVDGNGWNNDPHNLVICPSTKYHSLLHKRERARSATGDPNKLRCYLCKQWDAPENIVSRTTGAQAHRRCANIHRVKMAKQKRERMRSNGGI